MELLILVTAIIFYTLGRYSGHEYESAVSFRDTLKKKLHPAKGKVIDYPTAEEIEYNDSYERKVDEAREKVFKDSFKPITHDEK